jgi:type II secretory pathway pseudopilin PulG
VETQNTTPQRSSGLKRYGPLIAIVAVLAVVAVIVIVASSGGDDDTASTDTTSGLAASREGVVSWSQAEADGTTDSIDWGERCDTTTGQLAYPSFFAGECYAPFTGDNGGATATGVTADSIKVIYYLTPEVDPVIDFITSEIQVDDTNADSSATLAGFNEFYSKYFETYGRTVDLEFFTGTGPSDDPIAARADAVTIANMQPFAVLGGPVLVPDFADELAARQVLCIGCTPAQGADFYEERSPYVWSVANTGEQAQTHSAEFITKQLAGRKAQYAGDPALKEQDRKFGLIYLSTSESSEETIRQFEQNLQDGGVDVAVSLSYASPIDLQTSSPQYIAQMKEAGVTTVMFTGDPIAPQPLTRAATSQDYSPEWYLNSTALADTTAFARTYDQEQWKNAFGVSTLAARVDPSISGTLYLWDWYFGTPSPTVTGGATTVPNLQTLYAVLQGMGPDVNATNFKDALFAADATRSAVSQPSLSWGDKGFWPYDDYAGIDDATILWWDPTATGPDEIQRNGTGMYRYVDGGKRYLPGQWPDTDPPLFQMDGSVAIYTTPPPGEAAPTYPSPAGS